MLFYLLACLVPFLPAGKYWFIAIMGLAFPLLFFALLFFLIYWIFRKSKWAFLCAAVLLVGIKQVSVFFSFRQVSKFDVLKAPGNIRVMTWNLSSWGESNRKIKSNPNYQKEMVEVIKKTNADVLCFQEYLYYKDSKYYDSVIPALKDYGYKYSYFAKSNYTKRIYKTTFLTQSVILSKFPILDSAYFFYNVQEFSEPLIYADIQVNDKKIRVFSTHLESVRFENYDYEALHKLKEPMNASIVQSRAILYKLKQAYRSRSQQAEILASKIKQSPYPVIVCGDMNDVPNSYTYFTIKDNLQDAFLEKGSGLGRTFRFISPTLRIDYILANKNFKVKKFNKIEVPYSDHYPIIADFDFTAY
ncbi:MAG TPA: endonuclease/exonuclease/phosphatase family protein [Ferruginibacter sp.]|nr:endonuclease/exonuclease/phosphatase family protein [Ferruginibacter sp.]